MARQYWTDDDYLPASEKIRYMCDYALKMGRKKDLREVQIQKLADLTYQADTSLAIEYFETLPSNFKKAFKTAWRQRLYKQQRRDEIFIDGKVERAVKAVELDSAGDWALDRIVEAFVRETGVVASEITKPKLRGLALQWAHTNVTK